MEWSFQSSVASVSVSLVTGKVSLIYFHNILVSLKKSVTQLMFCILLLVGFIKVYEFDVSFSKLARKHEIIKFSNCAVFCQERNTTNQSKNHSENESL